MKNLERIKSAITSGLKGHVAKAQIEKYYKAAASLVKIFEQSSKLGIEDKGVLVTKFNLGVSSEDPDRNVGVSFNRRHRGLFPFAHDHCTVTVCFDWVIDGKAVEICVEIEYPCNVDWPIIGRLD